MASEASKAELGLPKVSGQWHHRDVHLTTAMLEGFANELEKIGQAKAITDPEKLKKILRPGDILFTKPRNIEKLTHKAFYAIESRIQGSPYTHVGLYIGDGKIVDAGSWRKGQSDASMAVHEVPLKQFTDRYSFKVLRVSAPAKKKQEAVSYAKEQVGKDFNLKGMFRLVLPKGKAESRDRKDAAESFFCSELVANAYNGVNIAKERHLHHVMPGDIAKSPLTKTVAQFK